MKRADCSLGLLFAGLTVLLAQGHVICRVKSKPKCTAERRMKFTPTLSGHSHGKGFSSQAFYESPEGVKIIRTGETHASPERAAERLEAGLKEAVRIIERRPAHRKRRGGERVVAVFVRKEPDRVTGLSGEVVLIMSTHEEVFTSIEAPTVCAALAFERQWEN